MLNNNLKYPSFDTLELVSSLEYNPLLYAKLKPAKAGDFIDGLAAHRNKGKWHPVFDENIYNRSRLSFAYTRKPLVIYFYAKQWGEASTGHLKQLTALQQEIQYHNGNLLVITAENAEDLKQLAWDHNLSLQFYTDTQNEIAQLLGIYSESSPAWNHYAGIEDNVALPSIYVLDNTRQVVFEYINEDILSALPLDDISTAVYQGNKYLSNKKSA